MSVGTVIVAHQISRRRCPGKRLGDLPGQPLGGRIPRHLEPQQLSPAMAQDQKRKREIKGQSWSDAHINCGDRLSVISKKSSSSIATAVSEAAPCIRDRRLGYLKPQFQKLAINPGCTPQWVFLTHSLDQFAKLAINPWPPFPVLRFPTPEGSKFSTTLAAQ